MEQDKPGFLNISKLLHWGKLLSITGFSQSITQGIGLLCGILVIRLLTNQEYALYTLANTMLGTMLVLADGGVSAGVMSLGGKVWNDRDKLGTVLITGLELRKKFAVASLIVALPILIYLLRHHGANWIVTIFIMLSIIPAFVMALSGSLLEIVPKLQQDVYSLQRIQIKTNVGRLILISISVFIFPVAAVAIIASGMPQVWANIRLKKLSNKYAEENNSSDPAIRENILSVVRRMMPGSIYYCLSGQVTIWLISIFGNTKSVAQVGALSRLSIILNVFVMIFSTVIIPRFARLPNDKKILFKRYLLLQIGILTICSFFILIVSLFPSQMLYILGKGYSGISEELVLCILGSCISLIAGISFSLSTSRGWIINPVISIGVTVTTLILGILLINISTLKGIFKLNIFISSIECVMYIGYCIIKIFHKKNVEILT